MATAWQTLEEAALTLGISSRTLHRRIAKGEFETRLENNRREVLVSIAEPELPDDGQEIEQLLTDASVSSATYEQTHPEGMSAEVQSTMLALHEDRIRRTDLAIMAYQQSVNVTAADARRAHVTSRIAWGTAATLTTILFLAVTWATHSVTHAEAEVQHLSAVVRQLSDTADARTKQVDVLRQETEAARLSAARIEGQLSATKIQLDQVSHRAQPANDATLPPAAATTGGGDMTPSAEAPSLDPTTKPVSLRDRLTGFLVVQ